ncbi:MAG: hypothetical protein AB7O80_03605 [Acetobacteraceae bacterium]
MICRYGLTIEAAGTGVEIAIQRCAGRAILVVAAHEVVIVDMAWHGIRIPSGNRASMPADGGNLTIGKIRFLDNWNFILFPVKHGSRSA